MKDLTITNRLLLFIVIPLVLYLLHILSFIFIPLVGALLVALIFMPLLRKLNKKNVPKILSILLMSSIIVLLVFISVFVFKLSLKEISTTDALFWDNILLKINKSLVPVLKLLGIDQVAGEDSLNTILHSKEISVFITKNVGKFFGVINRSIVMFFMTVFFLLLLLAGSLNVQKLMENAIFKKKRPSMKTFVILEKSIVRFIIVKFLISLGTGIGFSLSCYAFDVPFPIFWGLIAFSFNFVQMVGSIVSTIIVAIFAVAQLDTTGSLLPFVLCLVATQVAFGSILEPIFMGKTFSINTITILVMLMLWGFIWGVPGLILSIPITVALKTILDQFKGTKVLAQIMS